MYGVANRFVCKGSNFEKNYGYIKSENADISNSKQCKKHCHRKF